MPRTAVTIIAVLLIFAQAAFAGVLIRTEDSDNFGTNQTSIRLESDRMRVEGTDGQDRNFTLIYRADKQELWMLDVDRKVYAVIDRPTLDRMHAAVVEAEKRFHDQLGALPPEQRERIEAAAAGEKEPPTYKQTASGVKIGPWTTRQYDVAQGGVKVRTIYTAPWSDVGAAARDFAVLESYAKLSQDMGAATGELFDLSASGQPGKFDGFPVKTEKVGDAPSVSEVKEVKRGSFPATLFEIPSGYERVDMTAFYGPQTGAGGMESPK